MKVSQHNGVNKPHQGLAQVDRSASVTATITIPGQLIRTATDWITDKPLEINKGQDSVLVQFHHKPSKAACDLRYGFAARCEEAGIATASHQTA